MPNFVKTSHQRRESFSCKHLNRSVCMHLYAITLRSEQDLRRLYHCFEKILFGLDRKDILSKSSIKEHNFDAVKVRYRLQTKISSLNIKLFLSMFSLVPFAIVLWHPYFLCVYFCLSLCCAP